MADQGFSILASLAYKEAGLVLSPSKSAMIHSRLRHRLKKLGLSTLSEYCTFVESTKGKTEKSYMISALTTNVSSFFREPHHFSLAETVFERLSKLSVRNKQKIRLWSAGCSNGQEPYSLAIHILEKFPELAQTDLRILATDIDTTVLSFARHGKYGAHQLEGMPQDIVARYFTSEADENGKLLYSISESVKDLVSFRRLNLIDNWPMKEKYHIVFCRNVVIYFDARTQELLWPKFHSVLGDGGIICVGHSERINDSNFEAIGPTAYLKRNLSETTKYKTTERVN